MRKIILLSALLLAGFFGCDDKNPASSSNPFEGTWTVTLAGDATGQGTMTIDADGNLSGSCTAPVGQIDIGGTVDNAGALNGTMSSGGTQIGTFSGTLSGSTGSGTWGISSPIVASGTWTATKQ